MPRSRHRPRVRAALAVAVAAAVVVALLLHGRGGPSAPVVPTPAGATPGSARTAVPDPFAWTPAREPALVALAAQGTAHPLFALSPGGAVASAIRTARWRPLIERTARSAHVDADRLEALVFLESAGRADAQAPGGAAAATGLTQIVAETGRDLLGMRIDERRSAADTRRIARALRHGHRRRAAALERDRRRADPRYDPARALAATGRYLAIALRALHRQDLAFEAYHMGIGNLTTALHAYGRTDISYARLYFDSTPVRHARAYRILAALGDDSRNYEWKLGAAERIMALFRTDPEQLARDAALQTRKNSAEEVLHPLGSTPVFHTPAELRAAWAQGQLRALPDRPLVTGLRRGAQMGQLAGRLHAAPALYRGLRPPALAVALYIGAEVRAIGHASALTLTSTVRDEAYQRLLVNRTIEATQAYSLHTTGWAFDVARRYASRAQALAFQYVLDRLQVLNAIAWVREPGAIHVTVAGGEEALLPLLDRLGGTASR